MWKKAKEKWEFIAGFETSADHAKLKTPYTGVSIMDRFYGIFDCSHWFFKGHGIYWDITRSTRRFDDPGVEGFFRRRFRRASYASWIILIAATCLLGIKGALFAAIVIALIVYLLDDAVKRVAKPV